MRRFPGLFPMCGAILSAALGTLPAAAAEPPSTTRDLVRADKPTLDALFAAGTAGPLPAGYFPGRAIPEPGTQATARKSRTIGMLWKGKVLHGDGTAHNRVMGLNAVPMTVYEGTSWRDGGPVTVIDYADSWRMFRGVRDELREVSPGLYLGVTYTQKRGVSREAMMFTLQAPK